MPWKFPLQETPHFNRKSSCSTCGMVLIFSGITHFSNHFSNLPHVFIIPKCITCTSPPPCLENSTPRNHLFQQKVKMHRLWYDIDIFWNHPFVQPFLQPDPCICNSKVPYLPTPPPCLENSTSSNPPFQQKIKIHHLWYDIDTFWNHPFL